MRVDTNTRGHRQWFYFSIKNKEKKTIKLNIYRFKKPFSLYQRGMKPYVKSLKSDQNWKASGSNVKYLRQKQYNQYGVKKHSNYFYLTFTYNFQYDNDQVFFAAGVPYTYSFLQQRLLKYKQYSEKQNRFKQFNINEEGKFKEKIKFQILSVGKSMCGLNINVIKIQPNKKIELNNKKIICINCRTHPGQASSSWVLDGMIKALSQQQEFVDWLYDKNICFHILPMLNPDGVFVGNYRTGIIGDDFNRKFYSGKKEFFPEIYYLKRMISEASNQGQLLLFLDIHGHSILKNSFIYGPSEMEFQSFLLKKLPTYLWHKSKYFRMSSCKFYLEKQKIQTARIYFQLKQNVLAFTCQNSLGLYSAQQKTFQMKIQDWQSFGQSIIHSIKAVTENQKNQINHLSNSCPQSQTLDQKYEQMCKSIQIAKSIAKTKKAHETLKTKQKLNQIQRVSKDLTEQTIERDSTQSGLFSVVSRQMNKQIVRNQIRITNKFPLLNSKQINNKQTVSCLSRKPNSIERKQSAQVSRKNSRNKSHSYSKRNQQSIINRSSEKKAYILEAAEITQNYKYHNRLKMKSEFGQLGKNLIPAENIKQKVLLKNKIKFNKTNQRMKNQQFQTEQQYINPFEKINTKQPERSVTYDESYLMSQIEKMKSNQQIFNDKDINKSQNSEEIVHFGDNFSQKYDDSLNDSDGSDENITDQQKNYIFDYIRNSDNCKRQKKFYYSSSSDEENDGKILTEQQRLSEANLKALKKINAFRQIVFKESPLSKNIIEVSELIPTNLQTMNKVRKNTQKFKEVIGGNSYTHSKYKSLSHNTSTVHQTDQQELYISQKKMLNERFSKKQKRKQPFVLLSIKQRFK